MNTAFILGFIALLVLLLAAQWLGASFVILVIIGLANLAGWIQGRHE